MKKINLLIKRLFDFFGSLVGSIVITPILIFIAISIKLTSKGPVLFKQERLGKGGEVFMILKYRTMIIDAEQIGDGLFIKSGKDPRITKIGKLLRSTSLDELPQLWNVLVGEMSLVGPRPPVLYYPYLYDDYTSEKKKRFLMKPGITGLAQVKLRNTEVWDERLN